MLLNDISLYFYIDLLELNSDYFLKSHLTIFCGKKYDLFAYLFRERFAKSHF
jgi:hypothetical protein